MLAGGDAGQEQLREEPEGSQLVSLAPESLQLVARLQGEERSPPYPPSFPAQEGLNCKVLAGGDAGQEQLGEEPEGSQVASLASESLQLVARLQGEEEESALPPSFPLIPLIPPTHWVMILLKYFKQC